MFQPKRVYFEPQALDYPLGKKLFERFSSSGTEVILTPSHNRVAGIPGSTRQQAYFEAKQTLVVGVRKTAKFQSCRPSAHYQLPLVTSCPAFCEYCYLSTTMGNKPYIRVYANVEQILDWTAEHIAERGPAETVFEGSATSDPVPVEPYTGALARAIEFFAGQSNARFRFVTKFDDLDSVVAARHLGKTEARFSINAASIIEKYEHGTLSLGRRLQAARRCREAGYPVGLLVAPIFIFPGWRQEYAEMFQEVRQALGSAEALSFEFVTHRFTPRAKAHILSIYPQSTLDMEESSRKFKYGQFGYGKYVYPKETMAELREFFTGQATGVSPQASVLYTV
jgi:spore photoproduct lyase